MSAFEALWIEKTDNGFTRNIITRNTSDLPSGDLLIEVAYSSLNYKDAMSATGAPGVTRNYPHTPGIDAAGIVLETTSSDFAVGDEVIVIGFDLGMDTPGGFGQRIRVPSDWAIKKPDDLTLKESMILGTAGFTAALAIKKLEDVAMSPEGGPVLVTGATGGVGSVAVRLLSHLNYEVHAVSGKPDQHGFLKDLGAAEIISREDASANAERPIGRETWGGVIATVGGDILVNGLKGLRYGQSLASCGLVLSPSIKATVLPFILRHVNLLGIDSVQLPIDQKRDIWQLLASSWKLDDLENLSTNLELKDVSEAVDRILQGQMVGRCVVNLRE